MSNVDFALSMYAAIVSGKALPIFWAGNPVDRLELIGLLK